MSEATVRGAIAEAAKIAGDLSVMLRQTAALARNQIYAKEQLLLAEAKEYEPRIAEDMALDEDVEEYHRLLSERRRLFEDLVEFEKVPVQLDLIGEDVFAPEDVEVHGEIVVPE